jgi:hypothetical protein
MRLDRVIAVSSSLYSPGHIDQKPAEIAIAGPAQFVASFAMPASELARASRDEVIEAFLNGLQPA